MLNSRFILLGACLCTSAVSLLAQDCHLALRGYIMEADNKEPLAYATISVKEAGKGAIADENGYYQIVDLCENTQYTIEISHIECAHFTQVLQISENTTLDFRLQHNTLLKEVLIREKAVAPTVVQAESTVSKLDLAATQGVNLGETLKRLPGVSTLNTGSTISKPVIQGLHSNRIAIVNNNVVLEGQQWGSEHAPEIDPFTAGKIAVVKGAAGVRYGVSAMAGAVILEPAPLREKEGIGGWLSLGGFSNGLGGVLAGAGDWHLPGRSLTFRLQGTAKRSGNLRAPDYWLGNTGLSEYDASSMAGWRTERWTHEVSANLFTQQLAVLRAAHVGNLSDLQLAIASDTIRNNDNRFSYTLDRPYQRILHQTIKYRTVWHITDKWKLSGQYSFQFNNRSEYDIVRQSGSAASKPQIAFRLWSNNADIALEHFPIRHWQGGVGVQGVQQLNYVSKGGFIPDYSTLGGGIWAMERWRKFPQPWEFELGARYDYRSTQASTTGSLQNLDTLVHFGNISGTGGLVYHFSSALDLTLHSGYAWRPPHVNELFARGIHFAAGTYEEGNKLLRPEKAWNSNLSLHYEHNETEASLSFYRNQIQDFIFLNPGKDPVLTVRGAFPAYYHQQADAVLQGIDADFSIPVYKNWYAEGRASILRAYRLASDGTTHDWLPLMPADRFQYGIRWGSTQPAGAKRMDERVDVHTHPLNPVIRLMLSTTLHQTRIPAEGLLKAAPPAFTLLNVDVSNTFHLKGHDLECGLMVQNLGNVRYREYLNFFRFFADEPGINAGIRAKLIF